MIFKLKEYRLRKNIRENMVLLVIQNRIILKVN